MEERPEGLFLLAAGCGESKPVTVSGDIRTV